ncbi:hypothetical protein SAMN04515667_1403 [Formosa sp. Hel1_31_208]|uniref:hypothetical protein n=1 Tax=Formosa sp. Hel1_31_208 TaxID=1798225 RepID=UPI00087B2D84|nr:hypothetical protein [Formosa sp. Hel1_31_208]SDS09897.1 hypothetical protein SAMN04515667_1403 [Formosa sp. Hel1_31_208]
MNNRFENMKSRWCISILIIALTVLGSVASKQQVTMPNQEIVLQFVSTNVSINHTQNAITIVKEQLEAAGIENIYVQEKSNGHLTISYYSETDIASIKALLSEDPTTTQLGLVQDDQEHKIPSEEKSIHYSLDVYEIQQGDDLSSNDGKLALETKVEHERFSNTNVFTAKTNSDDERELDRTLKVAYKFNNAIAIAIDNRSRNIPEVRAGPRIIGMYDLS